MGELLLRVGSFELGEWIAELAVLRPEDQKNAEESYKKKQRR